MPPRSDHSPMDAEPEEGDLGLLGRRIQRRKLVAAGLGVAGLGAAATGVALVGGQGDSTQAPSSGAAVVNAQEPGPTPAPTTSGGAAAPPTGTPAEMEASDQVVSGAMVPEGMALVTSPRLPLFGIGSEQLQGILGGQIVDWTEAGSAARLPVEVLALEGQASAGVTPAATFPDYDALVAGFVDHPGGVALVPLEQVDFRANVLSVDGVDPLRDGGDGGEPLVRIGVVGDIVPGRNVHAKMVFYGDFTHPFLEVADTLASFDLTVANLEGNLSATLPQPSDIHSFSFVSDPAMIEGLKLAGIDAVSLANNHSHWNSEGWGAQGLLDTIDALEAADLPFFGAGRTLHEARQPWVTEVKGLSVAVLGVDGVTANLDYPDRDEEMGVVGPDWGAGSDSPGTNPFAYDQVVADIAAAVEQYDIVIPYLHMGAEYRWIVPAWVQEIAHGAIDAGATMVVTNHPHIIQGMEVYGGKPIVYSVGNFIFDQMYSVDTRQGLILEITLRGPRVVGIRTHGVEIQDFHQPRLMTGGEQAAIMDRFWRSTYRLADRG